MPELIAENLRLIQICERSSPSVLSRSNTPRSRLHHVPVNSYLVTMDSRRLSADQVHRVRVVMLRQSRYLHRLVDRMVKLQWRTDDPVWLTTIKAREATDSMLRELVVH